MPPRGVLNALNFWFEIIGSVLLFLVPFLIPPNNSNLQIAAPEQTWPEVALVNWQEPPFFTLSSSTLPPDLSSALPSTLSSALSSSLPSTISSALSSSLPPTISSTLSLKLLPTTPSNVSSTPSSTQRSKNFPDLTEYIVIVVIFFINLYLGVYTIPWHIFGIDESVKKAITGLSFDQIALLITIIALVTRYLWIILYHKRKPLIPDSPLNDFYVKLTSGKWNPAIPGLRTFAIFYDKYSKKRKERAAAAALKRAREHAQFRACFAASVAEFDRERAARRAVALAAGQSTELVPFCPSRYPMVPECNTLEEEIALLYNLADAYITT
ncbi:hypothetical protein K501DRAFT_333765 [Backusella circina FSU 941]|nr:hypothetical protein K501DRAFT_333765 [Backusella circina FSU 941]